MCVRACVRACACVRTCVRVCVSARACVYVFVCLRACKGHVGPRVCVYVCVRACVHACASVCLRVCVRPRVPTLCCVAALNLSSAFFRSCFSVLLILFTLEEGEGGREGIQSH